jgi:hypothetical protein
MPALAMPALARFAAAEAGFSHQVLNKLSVRQRMTSGVTLILVGKHVAGIGLDKRTHG